MIKIEQYPQAQYIKLDTQQRQHYITTNSLSNHYEPWPQYGRSTGFSPYGPGPIV